MFRSRLQSWANQWSNSLQDLGRWIVALGSGKKCFKSIGWGETEYVLPIVQHCLDQTAPGKFPDRRRKGLAGSQTAFGDLKWVLVAFACARQR